MTKDYTFTKEGIVSPVAGSKPLLFSTMPYQHQLECLQLNADKEYFALLADMGTGKTWVMINNFAYLAARKLVNRMLVFAPNGVQWNWVTNELPLHMPSRIAQHCEYQGYAGGIGAKAKRELEAFLDSDSRYKVLCMNWDALSNERGFIVAQRFAAAGCMIVLDESDYVKNPEAKRAKALLDLKQYAKYRRIMTGTPITNSPFDAYVQFNFLSESILDCPSYYAFKQRHGVFLPPDNPLVQAVRTRSRGNVLIIAKDPNGRPQYKELERLTAQIKPVSFRAIKSMCLDLPPKIYVKEYVELTPKQRKVYDQVKNAGLVELLDELVPITNKVAILTHLAQITGNHYSKSLFEENDLQLDPNATVIDEKHNPKCERALELINQAISGGEQVLVWCRYRAEIHDLMIKLEAAGISAVSYFGDTSIGDRQKAIEGFQAGRHKVFISNPQSGGTGLTLTAGSVVIYYSNSFSLHDRLQSEDRCHRIGQSKSKVTYIDLMARDTIDTYISDALAAKFSVAQIVTGFK